MDYIGLMAFELFEAQSGELVVNEIAPRVHNSAHYSLEAVSVDQFTLHLQCVLGHQLNQPKLLSPAFAMMNLIGSSSSEPSWAENDHVKLHWYGKSQNRSGRKMGHITALGSTPEKALKLVLDQRGKFSV